MSSAPAGNRRLLARTLPVLAAAAVSLATFASPAAGAAEQSATWRPDLSTVTDDDSNVVTTGGTVRLDNLAVSPASARTDQRFGMLVADTHQLSQPANTVSAAVDATVPAGSQLAVEVRGQRADGQWSEWTEATADSPAVLPYSTTSVQARLSLTAPNAAASPQVRGLSLTASTTEAAPTARLAAASAGNTYRIYATREGLVGGTTANGHVITSRDHFVALPSRRGLSSKGTGTYSVRLCTTGTSVRCEWAPVWDVGPWNIADDYWNPSDVRQMWQDLPQGKPEAQAAYQDNYNNGYDDGLSQRNRKPTNPAGIDLADGTFWDGLKLSDNSWLNVTYLWTGTGPAGTIKTAGDPVNVRSAPKLSATQVGLGANYAQVRVECQTTGDTVTGSGGTSNVWYRINTNMYVSKVYVTGVSGAATC
ncbi:hypothetical protein [Goodfellowiella coeruleoviolacea]|uniref:Ig-like domain-containing protein n=1 Tax=Goodfellowiella coeruleoviolacea TaxID=334858 RepID=A0AAE3GCW3_9PSEU|nr:hypothetical protein [Goodfellowiella coeruleoviolacea]MCP2165947.1 hypothetical protein [Goodfellowiella coeruleoviolacea]